MNLLEQRYQCTTYSPVWGDVHTAHPWQNNEDKINKSIGDEAASSLTAAQKKSKSFHKLYE